MCRITTVSIFVAICLIGVTYGMDCSLGVNDGNFVTRIVNQVVNTCPSLLSSSTASYCCLRPSAINGVGCCEAGEFFGMIFGTIFVFALFVGCCCGCCACCPCYRFCHRNSTDIIIVPSGYQGNNGQNPTMAMQHQYQPNTGYTRA